MEHGPVHPTSFHVSCACESVSSSFPIQSSLTAWLSSSLEGQGFRCKLNGTQQRDWSMCTSQIVWPFRVGAADLPRILFARAAQQHLLTMVYTLRCAHSLMLAVYVLR